MAILAGNLDGNVESVVDNALTFLEAEMSVLGA
jgi:hypothetical protein